VLGDSAAMFVDATTYAFNLCAERKKKQSCKRRRLQLELSTPLVSLTTLLAVTFFVSKNAIGTLFYPNENYYYSHGDNKHQQPDIHLMMIFSVLNVVVDIVNITCFIRVRYGFGIAAKKADLSSSSDDELNKKQISLRESLNNHDNTTLSFLQKPLLDDENTDLHPKNDFLNIKESFNSATENEDLNAIATKLGRHGPLVGADVLMYHISSDFAPDGDSDMEVSSQNLNMFSAYTHVFADTIRSVAVFSAAFIANYNNDIDADVADAVAALVVSVIIILSLIPLLKGIVNTWKELLTFS